jgi:hypothetical protein
MFSTTGYTEMDEHGYICDYYRRYQMTALAAGGTVCKLVLGRVDIARYNDPIPYALHVPQEGQPHRFNETGRLDVLGPVDMDEKVEDYMFDLARRHRVDPTVFA